MAFLYTYVYYLDVSMARFEDHLLMHNKLFLFFVLSVIISSKSMILLLYKSVIIFQILQGLRFLVVRTRPIHI